MKLAAGEIILRQGQLASARFTVDMTSIANEDISDSAMNALLVAHLRSADFFDTEHHPTAQFTAGAAEKIATCTEGTPNFVLRGTFKLRGISRPLGLPSPSGDALRAACGRPCRSAPFPVLIAMDGPRITGQGVLTLDRTEFGSHYGSGKLFRFLGKHIVNDHIHLRSGRGDKRLPDSFKRRSKRGNWRAGDNC